jgi:hypothetical protein
VASCSPCTGMYPLEYLEPYHHFANVQVCDEWKGGDVKPVSDRAQRGVDQTMRNPSYATYESVQEHKSTQIHPASSKRVGRNTKAAIVATTTHPSLLHSDWNSSDDMLCRLPVFEIDMGIEMSVEDDVAPCDRDVYQDLFS